MRVEVSKYSDTVNNHMNNPDYLYFVKTTIIRNNSVFLEQKFGN